MEQLDPRRIAGRMHDGIMHGTAGRHRTHRHGGVGQALGQADEIGRHAETFGSGGRAQPAETGNHLVENQQDAVPRGDGAQPFQIAHGRHQHAGGPGQRLDDHRGDGVGPVQGDDRLQPVGQFGAMRRLAP
jgi:hypothetical protein